MKCIQKNWKSFFVIKDGEGTAIERKSNSGAVTDAKPPIMMMASAGGGVIRHGFGGTSIGRSAIAIEDDKSTVVEAQRAAAITSPADLGLFFYPHQQNVNEN